MVGRFRVEAAVDFLARRAVEIPDFEAKASRFDQGFSKSSNADVVGFALGRLDVIAAVPFDVAHGNKMPVVIRVCLNPSTSQELHESVQVGGWVTAWNLTLT